MTAVAETRTDEPTAWYPAATMRWANVTVWICTHGGRQVRARVMTHPGTKRPHWYVQVGERKAEGGRLMAVWEPLAPFAPGATGPLHPVAWAPIDPARWQHPLPEPMVPAAGRNFIAQKAVPSPRQGIAYLPVTDPPPPHEPLDPLVPDDRWPYPDVRLNWYPNPPVSVAEAEARVLRAYRTSRTQDRVGHQTRATCSDIPSEMVKIALRHAALEAALERRLAGLPPDPEAPAVRSAFTPTRRDLGDWVEALTWVRTLNETQIRIVNLRADDPVWSWRQIAERCGASKDSVRNWYRQACEEIFRAATAQKREA